MTLKQGIILSASILAGLGIAIAFAVHGSSGLIFGGLDSGEDRPSALHLFGSGIYGFGMTLVGVLLGALYRRLIILQKQNVNVILIRGLFYNVVRSPDFLIGLVGAPIVFGLVWQALGAASLPAYTVIALQNGFVANALISQISQTAPELPKVPTKPTS